LLPQLSILRNFNNNNIIITISSSSSRSTISLLLHVECHIVLRPLLFPRRELHLPVLEIDPIIPAVLIQVRDHIIQQLHVGLIHDPGDGCPQNMIAGI